MPDYTQEKSELRSAVRAQRRALAVADASSMARRIAANLERLPQWSGVERVALYLPQDGEVDTRPIADLASRQGKQLYLPVLAPDKHLDFALWQDGAQLHPNRYGIDEPGPGVTRVGADDVDLICLPLVAWSIAGDRLGMGGGYYDRSLADAAVLKVGLGYELQRRDALPREAWDVGLDFVVSEAALYDCR